MKITQSKLVELLTDLGVSAAGGWELPKLVAKANQDGGISRYRDSLHVFPSPEMEGFYDEIVADQRAGNLLEVYADEKSAEVDSSEDAQVESREASVSSSVEQSAPTVSAGATETLAVEAPPVKRRGRPPGSKNKPREVAAAPAPKKRGRPPGSKNKQPSLNGTNGAAKKRKAPERSLAVKQRGGPPKKTQGTRFMDMNYAERKAYLKKHPMQMSKRPGVMKTIAEELFCAGKTNEPVTKERIVAILKEEFPEKSLKSLRAQMNNAITLLRINYGLHVWKQRIPDSLTCEYWLEGDGRTPQSMKVMKAMKTKKQTPAVKKSVPVKQHSLVCPCCNAKFLLEK